MNTSISRANSPNHPCVFMFCLLALLLSGAVSTNAQIVSTFAGRGFFADGMGARAQFDTPNGVAVDVTGNVYVTDSRNNRVRKITTSGSVSTLAGNGYTGSADGIGVSAQFNYPTGIAVDMTGNVYVADYYNHRIRKIAPSGVVTTFAGSGKPGYADSIGIAAQFNYPFGIALDITGNLYIADSGNNRIRKITPSGVVTTLAGSGEIGFINGTGATAQFFKPIGVAVDETGNVYVADYGNHSIRKVSSSGLVITLAGNGVPGSTDGSISTARFNYPIGVTADRTGNVFVADANNHRIRKVTPTGVVSTFAGIDPMTTEFRFPYGIAIDTTGNVYVADLGNNSIHKITSLGLVTNLAGSNLRGFADGLGTIAQFNRPSSAALDMAGNVYVTDTGNHRVRKITSLGVVSTFAGTGEQGYVDGLGARAQFNSPYGIAVDMAGNVYVGDDSRIRKITPSGIVSTFAGSEERGYADGIGAMARFQRVYALAVDRAGNIYVADVCRIRKITSSGAVTTLAGNSEHGYVNDLGDKAQFGTILGIAVDEAENVYVADLDNHCIRKIEASGMVSTLAGNGNSGDVDGVPTLAQFSLPSGVAVDGAGNVYVADSFNNRIRKINTSGVVSTFAGSGSVGYADGVGATVQFYSPRSIAMDKVGNLFVVDNGNNRIRKITPAAPVSVKFTSINIVPMLSIAIAPHPVQNEANLTFTLSATARVDVLLFDVLGRLVREEMLGVLPEGTHEWALDMNAFPHGTYTVIVRAGTQQSIKLIQHIR